MPCATGASPTMSTTRMRGLSDAYGSWKIICILSCCRRAASGDKPRQRSPRQNRSPADSGRRPTASRPSVDLPHPIRRRGRRPRPGAIARSTSSTAWTTSSCTSAPSRLPMRAATSSDLTKRFDTPRKLDERRRDADAEARVRARGSWRGRRVQRMVAAHGLPAASRRPAASAAIVAQIAVARLHRSRNAQPGGRSSSDGVMPGICFRRCAALVVGDGTESSSPCVYGCARPRRAPRSRVPCSTMRPAYITHTRSARPGDHRQVVRDPDQRRAGLARELLHLVQDLALDRDVERGRRLVGDDEVGIVEQRDGDRDALAHAAGELMRIRLEALVGRRNADLHQRLARALARRRLRSRSRARGSPRSSARRCAGPDSASSSGPGRSSRSGCRACAAALPATAPRRSTPSSTMLPPTMRPGGSMSPMSE